MVYHIFVGNWPTAKVELSDMPRKYMTYPKPDWEKCGIKVGCDIVNTTIATRATLIVRCL
jgi:hypothetical protein